MFSFASGGTSIGGNFSANSFRNSPVAFGGDITQGDLSTGATTQSGDVSSEGGTSSQTANINAEIPGVPGGDAKPAEGAAGAAGAAEEGGIPKIPGFLLMNLQSYKTMIAL